MNSINISELTLISVNSAWYNTQHRKCSVDDFKIALKAAHLSYESACELFGKDSKVAHQAKKKVQYMVNQIDNEKSDIFELMMFKTSDWSF